MKVRKGDKVKIIAGKDKGKEGVIERVYVKQSVVVIPGMNMFKKHVKKSEQMPQGGLVDIPRPLNSAKVMLICPKCHKATRVQYKIEKDHKKRMCKQCKSII
jgi:large subunit ribosomal protein L24